MGLKRPVEGIKDRESNQTSDISRGTGVCKRRRKRKNSTMINMPKPLRTAA
jgi:hypothetical protein